MAITWKLVLFSTATVILIEHAQACRTKRSAGDRPYYFGHTDLNCIFGNFLRSKRSAPWRPTHVYKHGWIQFENNIFEWAFSTPRDRWNLDYVHTLGTRPHLSDKCKYTRERKPAGYSRLSVDCITKCARSYKKKYGSYNIFWNNCNMFANRMSRVLCSNKCPRWCR